MVRNLLPERNFHPSGSEITFYIYTPAKDGTIVVVYSWPTGALLDDPNAEVGPPVAPLAECIPAGIIMQEFIEFDNTRFSRDMSDFEIQMVGNKVALETKGWCHTRCITPDAGTVGATAPFTNDGTLSGKPAYFDINGYFTTQPGSVCVGTFQSERDAGGYARVYVDIPTFGRRAGL